MSLQYSLAQSARERAAYFTIRQASYREDHRLPQTLPDLHDEREVIIMAHSNGQVAGGARLVLARGHEKLPLESYLPGFKRDLPFEAPEDELCAEYGGLALDGEHRDGRVALGLYLHSEKVARSLGVHHVFFVTERVRSRLYQRAYRAAYGHVAEKPTEYRVLREFMAPPGSPLEGFGACCLSVITFHYGQLSQTSTEARA